MLPKAFQDITTLMEVPVAMWRAIFDAAGEQSRLAGVELSHPAIWTSLTEGVVEGELLDALQVLDEIGTDVGRGALLQACDDQQVDLAAKDEEPVREFARRVWIVSRSDDSIARVLVLARLQVQDAGSSRAYREFVGVEARALDFVDRESLRTSISKWCAENQLGNAVDVYCYERDGEHRFEVLRGEIMRRVVEIRAGRPAILDFQPASSDHIRYEPDTGRLGIATRSPRLLRMYREVFGKLIASNEAFFSNENICSLKPLQKQGTALFEKHGVPGINRVEVVELRWRRGDRDKLSVRARDCFRVLKDLGARVDVEGELVEATLQVHFTGGGRPAIVMLKVPSGIDIRTALHERAVERLLDDVGIRGSFGTDEGPPGDLWELYPWQLSKSAWRRHVGADFDRMLREKFFKRIVLGAVPHPEHLACGESLQVMVPSPDIVVGISEDPAIPLRSLTVSDVEGFELDLEHLGGALQKAMALEGVIASIAPGVLAIGTGAIMPSVHASVFLVARAPSAALSAILRQVAGAAQVVVVLPTSRTCNANLTEVQCKLPHAPFEALRGRMIEALGLREEVPAPDWVERRVRLILDEKRGEAWLDRIRLAKLSAGTLPHRFCVEVARANGVPIETDKLNALLSPHNSDSGVTKKAKSDALKAIKQSITDEGAALPPDIDQVFECRDGKYAVRVPAMVIE